MENDIQREIFNRIKKAICDSVKYSIVDKNAIKVTTPFLDWKGAPVSIYITQDGNITDGGQTLSQLKSLRVFEDFEFWPFKEDFYLRSQIQQIRGSLEPTDPESAECLLRFIQGVARAANFFEAKPITSSADKLKEEDE